MNWGVVFLIVLMVSAASYAIWTNMSSGVGNNRSTTRNRGISGDRGNDYQNGDLS